MHLIDTDTFGKFIWIFENHLFSSHKSLISFFRLLASRSIIHLFSSNIYDVRIGPSSTQAARAVTEFQKYEWVTGHRSFFCLFVCFGYIE